MPTYGVVIRGKVVHRGTLHRLQAFGSRVSSRSVGGTSVVFGDYKALKGDARVGHLQRQGIKKLLALQAKARDTESSRDGEASVTLL